MTFTIANKSTSARGINDAWQELIDACDNMENGAGAKDYLAGYLKAERREFKGPFPSERAKASLLSSIIQGANVPIRLDRLYGMREAQTGAIIFGHKHQDKIRTLEFNGQSTSIAKAHRILEDK